MGLRILDTHGSQGRASNGDCTGRTGLKDAKDVERKTSRDVDIQDGNTPVKVKSFGHFLSTRCFLTPPCSTLMLDAQCSISSQLRPWTAFNSSIDMTLPVVK
jgi:hypothetical protein